MKARKNNIPFHDIFWHWKQSNGTVQEKTEPNQCQSEKRLLKLREALRLQL